MNSPSPLVDKHQILVYGFDVKDTDHVQRAFAKQAGCAIKRVQYPPKPYNGFIIIELESYDDLKQALTMNLRELLPRQYICVTKFKPLQSRCELLPDDARMIEQHVQRQLRLEQREASSAPDVVGSSSPLALTKYRNIPGHIKRKLTIQEYPVWLIDRALVVFDKAFPGVREGLTGLVSYCSANVLAAILVLLALWVFVRVFNFFLKVVHFFSALY